MSKQMSKSTKVSLSNIFRSGKHINYMDFSLFPHGFPSSARAFLVIAAGPAAVKPTARLVAVAKPDIVDSRWSCYPGFINTQFTNILIWII